MVFGPCHLEVNFQMHVYIQFHFWPVKLRFTHFLHLGAPAFSGLGV